MNAPKIICCNHMQPHACASGHPKALLKFSTFDSESDSCDSESDGHCGPHGLGACLALCVGPQWPGLANTCLGLLPACVGTWPCTWLCPAMLFWCANTFWPALWRFPVTTGILAVFCRFGVAGMPPRCAYGPWGWVPPTVCGLGCLQAQSGRQWPNRRRCGMGAKMAVSHFTGVEILSLLYA